MRIVRMFVRSGLVTIAYVSGRYSQAICRFTRLPSRSDDKPERTRSQRVRSRTWAEIYGQLDFAANLQVSGSLN